MHDLVCEHISNKLTAYLRDFICFSFILGMDFSYIGTSDDYLPPEALVNPLLSIPFSPINQLKDTVGYVKNCEVIPMKHPCIWNFSSDREHVHEGRRGYRCTGTGKIKGPVGLRQHGRDAMTTSILAGSRTSLEICVQKLMLLFDIAIQSKQSSHQNKEFLFFLVFEVLKTVTDTGR
jgi:hypothetical protein